MRLRSLTRTLRGETSTLPFRLCVHCLSSLIPCLSVWCCRNIRKKLAAVAELERHQAAGNPLGPAQVAKVRRKAELEQQLALLPAAARTAPKRKAPPPAPAPAATVAPQAAAAAGSGSAGPPAVLVAPAAVPAKPKYVPAAHQTHDMKAWFDKVAEMVKGQTGLKLHEVRLSLALSPPFGALSTARPCASLPWHCLSRETPQFHRSVSIALFHRYPVGP